MPRQGTPLPKGPPAAYMPAPAEVTSMSTRAPAPVPEPYVTENGKLLIGSMQHIGSASYSSP